MQKKTIKYIIIFLFFIILFLFLSQIKEGFIDNNVLIYSNYVKDKDYKEIKFDLNIMPILENRTTSLEEWKQKMYERSTPI